MDSLPFELIKLILFHTYDSDALGPRYLSKALRVCRRWNKAGRNILWKGICLDDANMTRLLRSASTAQRHMIRDLTLSTSVLTNTKQRRTRKKVSRNASSPHLKSLSMSVFRRMIDLISKSSHLTTISIHDSAYRGRAFTPSQPFSYVRIQQLLDHLPPSIRNLEIDIRECEDSDIEAQNCLCTTIAGLLPRLERLRLCIPKLCPSLLVASQTLKSLTINMSWMDMYNTCACRQSLSRSIQNRDKLLDSDDRTLFVKAASSMLDEKPSLLPMMEQFDLISTYNFDEDWCGPSHLLMKDDFINDQTTAYPMWCINEDAPLPDELWAMRVQVSSDPDLRDIVGSSTMLEAHVETSQWTQDIRGGRSISAHPAKFPTDSKKPSEVELSILQSSRSEDCGVWTHEETAQDCLVVPLVTSLGETPTIESITSANFNCDANENCSDSKNIYSDDNRGSSDDDDDDADDDNDEHDQDSERERE